MRVLRKGLGPQVKIPLLIFQAGKDQVVLPGGENTFCNTAPNCTLLKKPFLTASHEILTEKDEIRTPAVQALLDFLGQ